MAMDNQMDLFTEDLTIGKVTKKDRYFSDPIKVTKEDLEELLTAREVGYRLRFLRKKRGLRGEDIANLLELDRSTYAGYESQNRYPPTHTLAKIAKVLNTSTDFLIGLTDNPLPVDDPKDVQRLFQEYAGLHWNGIPLTEELLKGLSDVFNFATQKYVDEKNGTEDK